MSDTVIEVFIRSFHKFMKITFSNFSVDQTMYKKHKVFIFSFKAFLICIHPSYLNIKYNIWNNQQLKTSLKSQCKRKHTYKRTTSEMFKQWENSRGNPFYHGKLNNSNQINSQSFFFVSENRKKIYFMCFNNAIFILFCFFNRKKNELTQ